MKQTLVQLLTHLSHPLALELFSLLPILGLLASLARRRQRRALAKLGSRHALLALVTVRRWRRFFRGLCATLGTIALVLAIAGPQWGDTEQPLLSTGRDIVVVLDASRSMFADDVLPNRFERGRASLGELIDAIERKGGHRVGLVAFAGKPVVLCPLTPDYNHLREALEDFDPDDPRLVAKPSTSGPTSGTRIGAGLKEAVSLLDPQYKGHQDILLISDGDDPVHDQEWFEGVKAARTQDIPISVVGIGDPDADSPVLDRDGKPVKRDGIIVTTRLHSDPLEKIARNTHGTYIDARTQLPGLRNWFREYVQPRPGRELDEEALPAQVQRYGWFYGAALALWTIAWSMGDRPPNKIQNSKFKIQNSKNGSESATIKAPKSTLKDTKMVMS